MTYFVTEEQRKASQSTCYFEFQKGKHENQFWKEDSLCIHMDVFDKLNLFDLFSAVIPAFAYYGITQVTASDYEAIKARASKCGEEISAAVMELDCWARDCFAHENCFTVLGI